MRLIAVAAIAGLTTTASADFISLSPVIDNTLFEDPNGAVSNGAGDSIFAGINTQGFERRGVLAFDVAGAVPVGSTILSATLTLNVVQGNGGDRPFSLFTLSSDWGEGASASGGGQGAPAQPGDATWLHTFYDAQLWTNPGGDFDPTSVATTTVGDTGAASWSSAEMTNDAQSWLDSPATNFGWIVIGDDDVSSTAKRFASREHSDQALRPSLVIEFAPVPAPGAACVLVAFVCVRRRRR